MPLFGLASGARSALVVGGGVVATDKFPVLDVFADATKIRVDDEWSVNENGDCRRIAWVFKGPVKANEKAWFVEQRTTMDSRAARHFVETSGRVGDGSLRRVRIRLLIITICCVRMLIGFLRFRRMQERYNALSKHKSDSHQWSCSVSATVGGLVVRVRNLEPFGTLALLFLLTLY
jgi:hypothetical protein